MHIAKHAARLKWVGCIAPAWTTPPRSAANDSHRSDAAEAGLDTTAPHGALFDSRVQESSRAIGAGHRSSRQRAAGPARGSRAADGSPGSGLVAGGSGGVARGRTGADSLRADAPVAVHLLPRRGCNHGRGPREEAGVRTDRAVVR